MDPKRLTATLGIALVALCACRDATHPAPPAAVPSGRAETTSCQLKAATWSGEVALAPGGPTFARVIEVEAVMDMPRRGNGPVAARLRTAEVALGLWVERVEVFLAAGRALGGVVYPKPRTTLAWQGAGRTGVLAVSLDMTDAWVEPREVRDELPCTSLALTPVSFDVRELLALGAHEDAKLEAEVPLAVVEGEPPVARLRAGPQSTVEAFGRGDGDSRRVVVETTDYFVAGWVPASSLTAVRWQMLRPMTIPRVGGVAGSRYITHTPSCRRDVALFGDLRGRRVAIGVLRAGARFTWDAAAAEAGAEVVTIEVLGVQHVELAEGARLLVRPGDVADC
jgi:hypothetical protein